MRRAPFVCLLPLLPLSLLAACGSSEKPKVESPPATAAAASAAPAADNPMRALGQGECTSLADYVGEACHDRSNMDRSTRAEGWCSDVAGTAASEAKWVADCTKHVKMADESCVRSSQKVRDMMSCDDAVDRTK